MPITWLDEIEQDVLLDKRVLSRVDFNVPLDAEGNVLDAQRIELAMPTIRYLLNAKAKVVILSHLGRPNGKVKDSLSLAPVANHVRDLLDQEIIFVHDCAGPGVVRIIEDAKPGQLIFLENVRFQAGEEKNDPVFSKILAKNADLYVDDAFGVVHRKHASVVGVTKFVDKVFGGLLLKKELKAFDRLTRSPKKPFVLMMGGAKVSSKINVLVKLLPKVDAILLGGAMAYTFLRASGQRVGQSMIEEDKIIIAANLLKKAHELGVEVCLPSDHVVALNKDDGGGVATIGAEGFLPNHIGLDIGPDTINRYAKKISTSETVFWNGPMGMFEREGFANGTIALMRALADCQGYTMVGGGDSIAALNKAGLLKKIDFVSTGGGAGLELLGGEKLPGLRALGYYD